MAIYPIDPNEPPKSWREFIKVHEAAELFPMNSDDELRELGEDIKKNGLILPVVFTPDGQLIDGRNRLEACERVGLKIVPRSYAPGGHDPIDIEGLPIHRFSASGVGIPAQVCIVTRVDPYFYAIAANIHRRHLTTEQKRELVAKLLKARPETSDRETARLAKVSPTTVGTVRRELEEGVQIGHLEKRTGADGKSYPAHAQVRPEAAAISDKLKAMIAEKAEAEATPSRILTSADFQLAKWLNARRNLEHTGVHCPELRPLLREAHAFVERKLAELEAAPAAKPQKPDLKLLN